MANIINQSNGTSNGINTSAIISNTDLTNVLTILNPLILKILIAIVILFIGIVIGKVAERIITRLLELAELDKLTRRRFGINIGPIISRTVLYFIIIFFLILALNKVGVTTALVNTVVVVVAVILVLFVLIGANDLFINFFAGLVILFRHHLHVGDVIMVKEKSRNIKGKIIEINLLSVRLETHKDEYVFVPNMVLFKNQTIKILKEDKK